MVLFGLGVLGEELLLDVGVLLLIGVFMLLHLSWTSRHPKCSLELRVNVLIR